MGAVHKVRHAIFGQFLPPPFCHTLSHNPGPSRKYVTHLGPPIFSRPSTKNSDKSPLYKFSLNCSRGFCPGGFLSGVVFVYSSFCHNTSICYNRKLNITLNFMFNMYDKKMYKRTSHALDPPPLSQTVIPTRTTSPLERDVLYGRPHVHLFKKI